MAVFERLVLGSHVSLPWLWLWHLEACQKKILGTTVGKWSIHLHEEQLQVEGQNEIGTGALNNAGPTAREALAVATAKSRSWPWKWRLEAPWRRPQPLPPGPGPPPAALERHLMQVAELVTDFSDFQWPCQRMLWFAILPRGSSFQQTNCWKLWRWIGSMMVCLVLV